MGLEAGDHAPDFSLPTSQVRRASLASMRGSPFVLYFYPKAGTPGCTREAVAFQESLEKFAAIGATVIGVSRDPISSLERFATKYSLAFPLASDEANDVARAYGVWVEKSRYGRKYMGVERATFLVDRAGIIARVWHNVRVDGHAAEVLHAAESL